MSSTAIQEEAGATRRTATASQSESTPPGNSSELFCLEINPAADTTIIFLHGVLSSHLEWAHVTPYLSDDYHLLLPDLNGHSLSSHIQPTVISASSDSVASLIRRRAHGGKAHVVGLSMGGFVALDLARRHRDVVLSVFATGAHPFEGAFLFMSRNTWIVWYLMTFLHALPDGLYWWICDKTGMLRHEELRREMQANRKWETVRNVYTSILNLGYKEVQEIDLPTLIIAGGKGDQVGPTARMGPLLREGGDARSKAVVVEDATHAWDLQFPELFARGIRAWIEGRELPVEFKELPA